MAWGKTTTAGTDDAVNGWITQLKNNSSTFRCLHIMCFRKLSEADFIRLFNALANNTTLNELGMSGHQLSGAALAALDAALASNSSLVSLDLGDRNLGYRGLTALSRGLGMASALNTLNLEFKSIDEDAAKVLGDILAMSSSLRVLKLRRNDIGNGGIQHLIDGMMRRGESYLTDLDVSENNIGDDGIIALADALSNGKMKLERLLLRGNVIGRSGGVAIAPSIVNLTSLQLAGTGIGDIGASALASSLAKDGAKIEDLCLDDCTITDIGGTALANALVPNKKLKNLSIKENNFGIETTSALGEALCEGANSTLVRLDLGNNKLPAAGLVSLCRSQRLQELGFFANAIGSENGVSDVSAALLAGGLPACKVLDLGGNELTDSHIKGLLCDVADETTALPALETLELGGNLITSMEDWLQTVTSFQSVRTGVDVAWAPKS